MNQTVKSKRIHFSKLEILLMAGFVLFFVVNVFVKIGLETYNIQLQKEDQKLSQEVELKEQEVNDLESEVNSLQDKSRVLGMLEDNVSDNQNNIYVMK